MKENKSDMKNEILQLQNECLENVDKTIIEIQDYIAEKQS